MIATAFACPICCGAGFVIDPFGCENPVPCRCTETNPEEPTVDDRDREITDSMAHLIHLLVQRLRDRDGRYAALVAAAERAASLIQSDYEGDCGIMGTAASVHADLTAAIRRAKGGAS